MRHSVYFFCFFCLLYTSTLIASIPYSLRFEGIPHKSEIEEVLNATSQLRLLQKHPPSSLSALRRRAEADLPNLKNGLQSLGYYDAVITFDIENREQTLLTLHIQTGAPFYFESVSIEPASDLLYPLTPEELGFQMGSLAKPIIILEAEKKILNFLTQSGYPHAQINDRQVLVNRTLKTVSVIYHVSAGPLVHFGPTEITGLENVEESYVRSFIHWKEGSIFDPTLIEKTQIELEESGLFNLITIHQAESANENGALLITIEVNESKHRTIAAGFSYTTQLGPGVLFEWEHRNIMGRGQTLTLRTNIWTRRQMAYAAYHVAHFLEDKQDLFLIAEVEREDTKGYDEKFVSLSSLLELQITEDLQLSYGLSLKQLASSKSDNDKQFTLIKLPLHLRYSNANHLLNPTEGLSINYKFTPTIDLFSPRLAYAINFLTFSTYYALTQSNAFVLAGKVSVGSIVGEKKHAIPPPERLYAGSENLLRGYGYQTVAPLEKGKPSGGLSLLVYSLELRAQFSQNWGSVFFWDVGNVYKSHFPSFGKRVLQSLGTGLRYFTPVGPLRFDFAFPLNKRKGLDSSVQFYFSIGQVF